MKERRGKDFKSEEKIGFKSGEKMFCRVEKNGLKSAVERKMGGRVERKTV